MPSGSVYYLCKSIIFSFNQWWSSFRLGISGQLKMFFSFYVIKIIIILPVMCEDGCVLAHMLRLEGTELTLSFYLCMTSRGWTQVTRLTWQLLYLWDTFLAIFMPFIYLKKTNPRLPKTGTVKTLDQWLSSCGSRTLWRLHIGYLHCDLSQ